jgi:hypothetical protein
MEAQGRCGPEDVPVYEAKFLNANGRVAFSYARTFADLERAKGAMLNMRLDSDVRVEIWSDNGLEAALDFPPPAPVLRKAG